MTPIKIGEKSYQLPNSHGELSLRQFLALRSNASVETIDYIAILLNTTVEDVMSFNNINIDLEVLALCDWIKEPCNYIFPLPLSVNSKYLVPEIGMCNFGQKLSLENVWNKASKEGKQELDIYLEALCIYFEPLILQRPFSANYMDVKEVILDWRCDIALPIANFFLKSWAKFLTENPKNSKQITNPNKSKQELIGWKSLAYCRPFSTLRNYLISVLTRFTKSITTRSLRLSGMRKTKQATNEGITI